MKRRKLLKYTSLATAGLAIAACGDNVNKAPEQPEAKADFGTLEKFNINLGIIPRLDATPLIIAKEEGYFDRYGLNVNLIKQLDWQTLEDNLTEEELDVAQAPFGMPMMAQLGKQEIPMITLMVLNLNGSAITLSEKVWNQKIRTAKEYLSFTEFGDDYRTYIKRFEEAPQFAIESPTSMDNFMARYWLAAMGINPDLDVELTTFSPSEMIYKLEAGLVNGYCVGEPWNQQAVAEKVGFVPYVNRDIWTGHPGQIIATLQPWVEKYPSTTRALMAAVLEACEFCDNPDNIPTIASILGRSRYINQVKSETIANCLQGVYSYGGFDGKNRILEIDDFNIFHFKKTDYLSKPNHANYPWHSYGVWLLTQMTRWHMLDKSQYPVDADEIIKKVYPVEIYEDVAKALEMEIPSDRYKVEPANLFIDQREFDPSQPLAYLSSFSIRANRPVWFI